MSVIRLVSAVCPNTASQLVFRVTLRSVSIHSHHAAGSHWPLAFVIAEEEEGVHGSALFYARSELGVEAKRLWGTQHERTKRLAQTAGRRQPQCGVSTSDQCVFFLLAAAVGSEFLRMIQLNSGLEWSIRAWGNRQAGTVIKPTVPDRLKLSATPCEAENTEDHFWYFKKSDLFSWNRLFFFLTYFFIHFRCFIFR